MARTTEERVAMVRLLSKYENAQRSKGNGNIVSTNLFQLWRRLQL